MRLIDRYAAAVKRRGESGAGLTEALFRARYGGAADFALLVSVLDAMLEELREEVRRLARQGTRGTRG